MTQAERGLFERIKYECFSPNSERYMTCQENRLEQICVEFEQQLHYLGGTVEVLSADKEALERRLAEAEKVRTDCINRGNMKNYINRELPRTHKGFRCQYQQDHIMRAVDIIYDAALTAALPEKK